jgi:hypothetical protein
LLNESAERFAEIMQGLKQMAADMQQELESTRSELRRGIFELPQETAESAAQMRRVIVDQIEALAELNRIVARHGRSLDSTEPARHDPLRQELGRHEPVRHEPTRPEPARPEPARRETEPVYTGGNRPPPRPAPGRDITGSQQPPRGDITGAPRRPDAPPPGPNGRNVGGNGNGNGSGWLSDLLTRASREDSPPIAPPAGRGDERAQRENAGALESLAVDVARMIDHEAAADLWERYKRGERGIFTRRLYTAQGQKAFDEIRRKYRADAEFRQTVEQYVHEFERLIDDVARGDRGTTVVRNYLTSDTGKVYTMLAHAAGRFD